MGKGLPDEVGLVELMNVEVVDIKEQRKSSA